MIDGLKWQDLDILWAILRFLEKRSLTIKFSKFRSESLHGDTDQRFKYRKICPMGNRWNRVIRVTKNYKISATSQYCRYCADRAQNLPRPVPNICLSQCSRFHPNRFTFDGVIAELVNNVLLPQAKHRFWRIKIEWNFYKNCVKHKRKRQKDIQYNEQYRQNILNKVYLVISFIYCQRKFKCFGGHGPAGPTGPLQCPQRLQLYAYLWFQKAEKRKRGRVKW